MPILPPSHDADVQARVTERHDARRASTTEAHQGPFFDLASDVLKCMVGSIEALRVLDVRAGTGRAMSILARDDVEPESYLGVDITPRMPN